MADARAYEINKVSEAIRNNSDLPIVYNGDIPAIDASDYDGLRKRAGYRLAYQEISKQENIESVVEQACIELDGKELESNEDISPEWMNRFINIAGEISTEEMQHIWAKVLAGEVVKPNSFSLKTLECLKNMSTKDAQVFAYIANYVNSDDTIYANNEINNKYNISYADILELDDCGLINANSSISMSHKTYKKKNPIVTFGQLCLFARSELENTIKYPCYILTRAGKELVTIARNKTMDEKYIIDVANSIKAKNSNVEFFVYRVIESNEDCIRVNDQESLI